MGKPLTEEQRRRRALTTAINEARRQAEAETAARILEAGPLFARQVEAAAPEPVNERALYERWRRNVAMATERIGYILGSHILDEIQCCQHIRKVARRLLGDETFERLDALCVRIYQNREFWYGFWRKVLTGERVVYGFARREKRQPGETAVVETEWYEQRHMSREEYHARFPCHWEDPAQPDDGGIAPWVRRS